MINPDEQEEAVPETILTSYTCPTCGAEEVVLWVELRLHTCESCGMTFGFNGA